jgi:M6 family metalloprotease-like protein
MTKAFARISSIFFIAMVFLAQLAIAGMDEKLGLVSDSAKGELRYLVIVVDFPDVKPSFSMDELRERSLTKPAKWYAAASHGKTHLKGSICGPFTMPDPLESYKVSPYNYQVDSGRVYKLVSDALSLAEQNGVPILEKDLVTVVHRARTMPGKGYGMICYCANPGMISKVRGGRARYVEIETKKGSVFKKGVVVMAENFHVGFLVHDLAHAMGGVWQGTRLAIDLYDFDLQSRSRQKFQIHDAAVYLGPWDLMSQHFIERGRPSPGFSLFTMIRMGYVSPAQVVLTRPGQTTLARLAPVSLGGKILGVKIEESPSHYWLVENRQLVKTDRALPSSGVMIYKVNLDLAEGGGVVKAANADPNAFNFSRAPFGLEDQAADLYVNDEACIAVAPLAKLGRDYLVLITTPQKAPLARRIAQGLAKDRGSENYKQQVKRVTDLIRQGKLQAAAGVVAN